MGRRLKERGMNVPFGASIATTGNTDVYVQADRTGYLSAAWIATLLALATSDTNYITWTITYLGTDGSGTTELLATSPAGVNTTKATGGAALVANARTVLTLAAAAATTLITEGGTIRIRAAVTGTLGAAVTVPRATLLIAANGQ